MSEDDRLTHSERNYLRYFRNVLMPGVRRMASEMDEASKREANRNFPDFFKFARLQNGDQVLDVADKARVDSTRDAPALAYCRRTNPEEALARTSKNVTCFSDVKHLGAGNASAVHLIVTGSESSDSFASDFAWIDAVPFPKTVYVKNHQEKGFRSVNRWKRPAKVLRRTQKYLPHLFSHEELANNTHRDESQQHNEGGSHFDPSFRTRLRRKWDTCVTVHEEENVGDESLSIAKWIYQHYTELPRVAVFLHAHRTSWHTVDLVRQLSCMCVDEETEDYRTLLSPEAFFSMNCKPKFDEVIDVIAPGEIGGSSIGDFSRYRRIWQRLIWPFTARSQPNLFVSDLCGSFAVTRRAMRALPRDFYALLAVLLQNQPYTHPIVGVDFELSMMLERMWRSAVFHATEMDFYRDLTNVRCRYNGTFRCALSSTNTQSSAELSNTKDHQASRCSEEHERALMLRGQRLEGSASSSSSSSSSSASASFGIGEIAADPKRRHPYAARTCPEQDLDGQTHHKLRFTRG